VHLPADGPHRRPLHEPLPDPSAAAPGSLGVLHATAALMRGLGPSGGVPGEPGRAELSTLAAAVAEAAAARGQPLGMRPGSAPPSPCGSPGERPLPRVPRGGAAPGFLDQLLKRVAEEEDGEGAGAEEGRRAACPTSCALSSRYAALDAESAPQIPLESVSLECLSHPGCHTPCTYFLLPSYGFVPCRTCRRGCATCPSWVPPGPPARARVAHLLPPAGPRAGAPPALGTPRGHQGRTQGRRTLRSGGRGFEGRLIEVEALLGPFLHISILPDHLLGNGLPDAR